MNLPPCGATPLAAGWRELISTYRLPVFPTLTFAKRTHPEAALKAWRFAVGILNVELHGKRWNERGLPGCQWAAAIERQKNWNPHVHALLGHQSVDLADPAYAALLRYMRHTCDDEWGFSRWECVKDAGDARAYIIDYAAKTGELYLSPRLELLENEQLHF